MTTYLPVEFKYNITIYTHHALLKGSLNLTGFGNMSSMVYQ